MYYFKSERHFIDINNELECSFPTSQKKLKEKKYFIPLK